MQILCLWGIVFSTIFYLHNMLSSLACLVHQRILYSFLWQTGRRFRKRTRTMFRLFPGRLTLSDEELVATVLSTIDGKSTLIPKMGSMTKLLKERGLRTTVPCFHPLDWSCSIAGLFISLTNILGSGNYYFSLLACLSIFLRLHI